MIVVVQHTPRKVDNKHLFYLLVELLLGLLVIQKDLWKKKQQQQQQFTNNVNERKLL